MLRIKTVATNKHLTYNKQQNRTEQNITEH